MNPVNPQNKISEKQVEIDGLNINYKTIGNGKIPIVLLHGWGVNSDKYVELMKKLEIGSSKFPARGWSPPKADKSASGGKILAIDLPGFGKSDEPNENWKLDDYVEFVNEFIEITTRGQKGFELLKNILKKFDPEKAVYTEEKIKPILIGHSFGGKIAIKYATKYPEKVEKLILTGAAGIKHKLTIKQKILFVLAKIGKIIFSLPIINNLQKPVYEIFSKLARNRKKDYYYASPKMKEIMKNILAEEISDHLDKIKTPTLLVWGKGDRTTPLSDGKIMNEKIQNSKLVIIDSANHSLPYQKTEEFEKIVEKFTKEHK